MDNVIEHKEKGIKVKNTDLWINEETTSMEISMYITSAFWTDETISTIIDVFANFQMKRVRCEAVEKIQSHIGDLVYTPALIKDINTIN